MSTKKSEKCYLEGATKYLDGIESGYIIKRFKSGLNIPNIQEQQKEIETKKKYFGKYIPETFLEENENGDYHIKQKFINGKLIKDLDVKNLNSNTIEQIIDLIRSYTRYCIEQNKFFDVFGYQGYSSNKKFYNRIRNIGIIPKTFLASSNIMIDIEGNVFYVDVCDTILKNKTLSQIIKKELIKPFLYMNISTLENLVKKKQSELLLLFENK